MHVGDLDGVSKSVGPNDWKATVTVTVHDSNDTDLSGATVIGTWSASGNGASDTCTTNGDGTCDVKSGKVSNTSTSSTTFTVDNVTNGLTYTVGDNHDPEIDSDGTSITVSQ